MTSSAAAVPVLPFQPEGISGVPLPAGSVPSRLVLVRLVAFGDTAGLLPILGALHRRRPDCRLEVVTDVRSAPLFRARTDVHRVHAFDSRANRLVRAAGLVRVAFALRREPLDAILDLQHSSLSGRLLGLVKPPAWARHDRYAPRNGLARYLDAAEWLGLGPLHPVLEPSLTPEVAGRARELLHAAGRDPSRRLVCLNPAGGWETKQWPLARWGELGRRLENEMGVQLLALGTGAHGTRFAALKDALGGSLLDLSGGTTPELAMAAVATASLIVSEDSGLMHLAWVQGVPTVALFGATRAVWSRPEGPRCSGFYSEDLECGACMQPVCARGDLLCLDRVTVDSVFRKAREVLA